MPPLRLITRLKPIRSSMVRRLPAARAGMAVQHVFLILIQLLRPLMDAAQWFQHRARQMHKSIFVRLAHIDQGGAVPLLIRSASCFTFISCITTMPHRMISLVARYSLLIARHVVTQLRFCAESSLPLPRASRRTPRRHRERQTTPCQCRRSRRSASRMIELNEPSASPA